MALVSPLILKLYAATQVPEAEMVGHAMEIQREVMKARWHVARSQQDQHFALPGDCAWRIPCGHAGSGGAQ
jgi:hypothetical protein